MENKVVEFEVADNVSCIICGKKDAHVQEIKIMRTKRKENLTSFAVCDECLKKIADETISYCSKRIYEC